ncbi:hypothetical protein [Arthrobacter cryoconiti]|uniref:Uncharacterized protein n=1 Tax=Arthrobacter cryoconiti TaxID=748907 RepID=A0ABV8R3N8_9MICC|nr:hypothetical protein [Arthrobacter cryoconiti]MCC9066854.1 hypothetical protein [Arthrobacter cryoconiti]
MTTLSFSNSQRTATTKRPYSVPVLPAVDVNLGTVSFFSPTGQLLFFSAEPADLVSALTQAVRPAQWIPEVSTLVITVAQTGVRAGLRLGFRLSAY